MDNASFHAAYSCCKYLLCIQCKKNTKPNYNFQRGVYSIFFVCCHRIFDCYNGYIVLFKFIDPAAADLIHEEIMVFTKTMMENFNSPSDVIALTMDEMQKNHSFSWMAIVQNYANALLRNAIFGLIIALIFKKS